MSLDAIRGGLAFFVQETPLSSIALFFSERFTAEEIVYVATTGVFILAYVSQLLAGQCMNKPPRFPVRMHLLGLLALVFQAARAVDPHGYRGVYPFPVVSMMIDNVTCLLGIVGVYALLTMLRQSYTAMSELGVAPPTVMRLGNRLSVVMVTCAVLAFIASNTANALLLYENTMHTKSIVFWAFSTFFFVIVISMAIAFNELRATLHRFIALLQAPSGAGTFAHVTALQSQGGTGGTATVAVTVRTALPAALRRDAATPALTVPALVAAPRRPSVSHVYAPSRTTFAEPVNSGDDDDGTDTPLDAAEAAVTAVAAAPWGLDLSISDSEAASSAGASAGAGTGVAGARLRAGSLTGAASTTMNAADTGDSPRSLQRPSLTGVSVSATAEADSVSAVVSRATAAAAGTASTPEPHSHARNQLSPPARRYESKPSATTPAVGPGTVGGGSQAGSLDRALSGVSSGYSGGVSAGYSYSYQHSHGHSYTGHARGQGHGHGAAWRGRLSAAAAAAVADGAASRGFDYTATGSAAMRAAAAAGESSVLGSELTLGDRVALEHTLSSARGFGVGVGESDGDSDDGRGRRTSSFGSSGGLEHGLSGKIDMDTDLGGASNDVLAELRAGRPTLIALPEVLRSGVVMFVDNGQKETVVTVGETVRMIRREIRTLTLLQVFATLCYGAAATLLMYYAIDALSDETQWQPEHDWFQDDFLTYVQFGGLVVMLWLVWLPYRCGPGVCALDRGAPLGRRASCCLGFALCSCPCCLTEDDGHFTREHTKQEQAQERREREYRALCRDAALLHDAPGIAVLSTAAGHEAAAAAAAVTAAEGHFDGYDDDDDVYGSYKPPQTAGAFGLNGTL